MVFSLRNYALAMLACGGIAVHAQTAVWQLPPSSYSNIQCVGNGLFKIEKAGKYGFIKADGTVLLDATADNVGLFYEGKALVTVRQQQKNQLLGVLGVDGVFTPMGKKYYTIEGQEFFSDNLLTVSDDKGKVGYIDEYGNAVLGFEGKYDYIKPFTEGFAAVYKNDAYSLINKRGIAAQMIIGIGEVYGGTNVCNGVAYIWDTDGKMYTYDVNTGKCSKAKEPANNKPDYLYCYMGASGRGAQPTFEKHVYEGVKGLQPTSSNGLYGYMADGKTVLPAQFDAAYGFVDGYAVVKSHGQWGILRYEPNGQTVTLTVPTDVIRYNAGNGATCWFRLGATDQAALSAAKVIVADDANTPQVVKSADNGKYTFSVVPRDGVRDYSVSLEANGLKLFEGKASYTFKKNVAMLAVRISASGTKANSNDEIPVTATISNPNDEAVTTEVRLTGSRCFVAKTATVTIPAKGSVHVSSVFKVKENASAQYATVTTSKGGHASTGNLSLSPFY